ncbi:hypothetical protein CRYUN_Cryun13aG0068900 [Craigia yunnanensis]
MFTPISNCTILFVLQDQKKLQGQLKAEQEVLYGSKPSPSKHQSVKKGPRYSTGGASNRRVSLGGDMLLTHKPESVHSAKAIPQTRPSKKTEQKFQNNHSNQRRDEAVPAFSVVRRGLDIADILVRKHSFSAVNANELESPLKTLPTNDLSYTTPLKTTSLVDEENRTPKAMPIPVPSTPSTVSVPMQTAMTPAPPIPFNTKPIEQISEEIEQSFRFAFMLSKTQITSLIQV